MILSDARYREIWNESAITQELNMDTTLKLVSDFHNAFEIAQPDGIDINPPRMVITELVELAAMLKTVADQAHKAAEYYNGDGYLLRVQLMAEELAEVVEAMADKDVVGTLHELADLRVVCDGTALCLGLGGYLVPAVQEIMRANMSKLDADGKPIKNAAGRVVKGPNFKKADVSVLLK